MRERTKKRSRISNHYGIPGNIGVLDETFESPGQMVKALDAFLAFIDEQYGEDNSPGQMPNLLGLFITRMKVVSDPNVDNVEVVSELGRGVSIIHAPVIADESTARWQQRHNDLLCQFWPSLEDAKIRALVQLYRLVNHEGREWLEKHFRSSLFDSKNRAK